MARSYLETLADLPWNSFAVARRGSSSAAASSAGGPPAGGRAEAQQQCHSPSLLARLDVATDSRPPAGTSSQPHGEQRLQSCIGLGARIPCVVLQLFLVPGICVYRQQDCVGHPSRVSCCTRPLRILSFHATVSSSGESCSRVPLGMKSQLNLAQLVASGCLVLSVQF